MNRLILASALLLAACGQSETPTASDSDSKTNTEAPGATETVEALSDKDIDYDYVADTASLDNPADANEPLAISLDDTRTARSREELVAFIVGAHVRSISDGDTISIETDTGARFRIRMSDMDTPETKHDAFTPPDCRCKTIPYRPGQPGGDEATSALEDILAVGDDVRAECYEADRYGRMVCHVFKDDQNINLAMIESGWGWLPSRAEWIRDPESATAQAEARAAERGAWRLEGQVSPAEWRRQCWREEQCEGSPSPRP
jgi:endonuclease YncB( thermonuclease family)